METNSDNKIITRQRPIVDSRIERQIVTGMILDEQFLREIKTIFKKLQTPFTNTIGGWCLDYLAQYNCAPGRNIEEIYHTEKEFIDETLVEMIENFLEDISDEYTSQEKLNTERLLDKAEEYFRLCSLNELNIEIKQDVIGGRIEIAESRIKEYTRVARPKSRGANLLDPNEIATAFEEEETDKLFRLPGDLGRLMGDFQRGQLSAFVGNSSIGKSWWLQLCAMTALFQGHKVLFVSLEMSKREMIMRIMQWLTGLQSKVGSKLLIPIMDCRWNQDNSCTLKQRTCRVPLLSDQGVRPEAFKDAPSSYKVCTECRGEVSSLPGFVFASWYKESYRGKITQEDSLEKIRKLEYTNILRGGIENLKYIEYPSGAGKMSDLKTHMNNLEYYEGWSCDYLVTDYADKFAPERTREKRFELEEIWEAHKAISQDRHIGVTTASQSNTMRTEEDIRQGSWQEAIAKIQLVDVGAAINQTPEEKEMGFSRVSILKHRHNKFSVNGESRVLQSLDIGRAYLDSYVRRARI
jgi:hypothetical protein